MRHQAFCVGKRTETRTNFAPYHRFFGLVTFLTGSISVEYGLDSYFHDGGATAYSDAERTLGVLSILVWAIAITTTSHLSLGGGERPSSGRARGERAPLIND